jgi:hypothetical protein
MKKFSEIKKELKSKGIEVRRIRATLNGAQAYKVIGSDEHNDAAIWTAWDIKNRYQRGEFA